MYSDCCTSPWAAPMSYSCSHPTRPQQRLRDRRMYPNASSSCHRKHRFSGPTAAFFSTCGPHATPISTRGLGVLIKQAGSQGRSSPLTSRLNPLFLCGLAHALPSPRSSPVASHGVSAAPRGCRLPARHGTPGKARAPRSWALQHSLAQGACGERSANRLNVAGGIARRSGL